REQQDRVRKLQVQIAAVEQKCRDLEPELQLAQRRWEATVREGPPIHWTLTEGLAAHYPLVGNLAEATGKAKAAQFRDGRPDIRSQSTSGRPHQAVAFDGKCYVDAGKVGDFGFYDKFSLSARVFPSGSQGGTILSRMQDEDRAEGYSVTLEQDHIHVHLV